MLRAEGEAGEAAALGEGVAVGFTRCEGAAGFDEHNSAQALFTVAGFVHATCVVAGLAVAKVSTSSKPNAEGVAAIATLTALMSAGMKFTPADARADHVVWLISNLASRLAALPAPPPIGKENGRSGTMM